jgi:hypothetical protein
MLTINFLHVDKDQQKLKELQQKYYSATVFFTYSDINGYGCFVEDSTLNELRYLTRKDDLYYKIRMELNHNGKVVLILPVELISSVLVQEITDAWKLSTSVRIDDKLTIYIIE